MPIYFLRPAIIQEYSADTGVTDTSCLQDSCHPCEGIEVSASGGINSASPYVAYTKTLTQICSPTAFDVFITYDAVGSIGNQFLLNRNGVTIWDTGCVNGPGSGSATVTVAGGATSLQAVVIGACNGSGDDEWIFGITCL